MLVFVDGPMLSQSEFAIPFHPLSHTHTHTTIWKHLHRALWLEFLRAAQIKRVKYVRFITHSLYDHAFSTLVSPGISFRSLDADFSHTYDSAHAATAWTLCLCVNALLWCSSAIYRHRGARSSTEPVAKQWLSVRSRCGLAARFLSLRALLCVCECVPTRRAHRTHRIKVRESRRKETALCLCVCGFSGWQVKCHTAPRLMDMAFSFTSEHFQPHISPPPRLPPAPLSLPKFVKHHIRRPNFSASGYDPSLRCSLEFLDEVSSQTHRHKVVPLGNFSASHLDSVCRRACQCLSAVTLRASLSGDVIQILDCLGGKHWKDDWWAWQQDVWIRIAFWLLRLARIAYKSSRATSAFFSLPSPSLSPLSVYSSSPAETRLPSSSVPHLPAVPPLGLMNDLAGVCGCGRGGAGGGSERWAHILPVTSPLLFSLTTPHCQGPDGTDLLDYLLEWLPGPG